MRLTLNHEDLKRDYGDRKILTGGMQKGAHIILRIKNNFVFIAGGARLVFLVLQGDSLMPNGKL